MFASAFGFQFLSETQVDFFNENGYLILREFSSASEMETLKKEMNRLIDDWDPDLDSVTVLICTQPGLKFVCISKFAFVWVVVWLLYVQKLSTGNFCFEK